MSDDLNDDYTDDDGAEESAPRIDNRDAAATRVQRKLAKENADLKIKLAIKDAGIDGLNDRQLGAIRKELEGTEATSDAVKQIAQELGFSAAPQVDAELAGHQAISQIVATPTAPPPPPSPQANLSELLRQMESAPPGKFRNSDNPDAELHAAVRDAISAAGLEWGEAVAEGGFEPL